MDSVVAGPFTGTKEKGGKGSLFTGARTAISNLKTITFDNIFTITHHRNQPGTTLRAVQASRFVATLGSSQNSYPSNVCFPQWFQLFAAHNVTENPFLSKS